MERHTDDPGVRAGAEELIEAIESLCLLLSFGLFCFILTNPLFRVKAEV